VLTQLSPAHGVAWHDVRRTLLATPGWEHDSSARLTRTYLDTFDWRVHRRGGIIVHVELPDGPWLAWHDLESGENPLRQRVHGRARFAWELPPGRLRDRLTEVLDVRALLPVATVHVERDVLRRVDSRRKTVARVALERMHVEQELGTASLSWIARVEPVLGYDRAATDAWNRLWSCGLVESPRDVVLDALEACGARPESYTSKLRIDLDRHATAREAFITVLHTLLVAAEVNRPGAIDDLDTEFLHDLRVSIRRARSVLKAATGVLGAHAVARVADDLRWLQRETGWSRDLDVWILGFDGIAATFPPASRDALEPLRAYLEKERASAHERLALTLESERTERTLAGWRNLADPDVIDFDTPEAEQFARDIAAERVGAALRTVSKRGRRIDDDSPAESLHALRKKAKQLRYLLECFRAVLPRELGDDLVPRLKKLQEVLGDHQDCAVQITELSQFARALEGHVPTETLLVMGELIARLRERQGEIRDHYDAAFRKFRRAAAEHRALLP
jgi:CHAD domain-containing protein